MKILKKVSGNFENVIQKFRENFTEIQRNFYKIYKRETKFWGNLKKI